MDDFAAAQMQPCRFDDGAFSLNYRFYRPDGERLPLLLFLHGAGERGEDNTSQLRHGIPSILRYLQEQKLKVAVLAPQCPAGMQWVNVPWSADTHEMPAEPSEPLSAVMKLVDQWLASGRIDPSRVYITGISMGGFGTWDYIQREPKLFAAALPICGGGDPAQAPRLKNLPISTFHGGVDSVVKVGRTREMVAALEQAGAKPLYTEYPGVDHDSWTQTYANPEVLHWLLR